MGRRPNALILQWFDRGPKLADNSNWYVVRGAARRESEAGERPARENPMTDRGRLSLGATRYPHTCKACGELFPKGRLDSLINHLTKKCPAISEADRINACLTLHGLTRALPRAKGKKNQPGQANPGAVDLPLIQRDWTALETLAEVSRQIDLNEKHDDRAPPPNGVAPAHSTPAPQATERFELQEQFTLENPPLNYENRQARDKDGKGEEPLTIDAGTHNRCC